MLPTGEVGQIAVRNATPFDGYVLAGALGVLDDAGRLRVEGRVDDMIVSGGENVYPAEVEAVLDELPRNVSGKVVTKDLPRP